MRLRWNKYIRQVPTPKQMAFLALPHREGMYGGSAGSGKSSCILMGALQYMDVPGYSALILRTNVASLKGSDGLIPRSHEWLSRFPEVKWSGSTNTWSTPWGATLRFGYLATDSDMFKYNSTAYQYIAFEEVSEFKKEEHYEYLFSRMRKPEVGPLSQVPLRTHSTSNPVGPGFKWVKRRFVSNRAPGVAFLPASMYDNPYLDHKSYLKSLDKLGPVLKKKIAEGDWSDLESGLLFPKSKFRYSKKRPDWRERILSVRAWDLAASERTLENMDPDYTVGGLLDFTRDGRIYCSDIKRVQMWSHDVEKLVMATTKKDGPGVKIMMFQDPAQAGKAQVSHYSRMVFQGYVFETINTTQEKDLFHRPLQSQVNAGNFYMVEDNPHVEACVNEASDSPYAEHDDFLDMASLGYQGFLNEMGCFYREDSGHYAGNEIGGIQSMIESNREIPRSLLA